ncbi:hypothetical protein QF002_003849 [Paraburkholderia youngii]
MPGRVPGRGWAGQILALHGERRHAVDLEPVEQFLVLLQRALRRERVVRFHVLLRIDAELRQEFGLVFRRQQIVLVDVDFVEDLRRQFVREAERVERVEHLRVRDEVVAEGDRHAAEHDVRGLLLDPRFEERVEFIAVRATVPEEFDDFDLAGRHVGRLRRGQHGVVLAGHRRGRRRMRARRDQAQREEQDAQQFFHVV